MNRSVIVAIIATLYLLVYIILYVLGAGSGLVTILFTLSPLVVLWLVFTVLKDDSVPVRELEDGEEWGYADRQKETLGLF
ncbi:hypothetical protein [Flavihumibacter sp. ZG627]|uniref:hypothetical protein n=1 Tax=Flavihumibacter sp. ZG627 TaxID=1463156 RepID=UPI00057D61DA|nr:hypothetical protein [Flavihumibacter sp. ZG627]KIC90585.1 hypothetical protein HY58_11605 [Flavihumibacter sp. ZG627]